MTTSVVFRNAQESSLFETYSFMNPCPFKWKRTSNSYAPDLYIRWVNSLPSWGFNSASRNNYYVGQIVNMSCFRFNNLETLTGRWALFGFNLFITSIVTYITFQFYVTPLKIAKIAFTSEIFRKLLILPNYYLWNP